VGKKERRHGKRNEDEQHSLAAKPPFFGGIAGTLEEKEEKPRESPSPKKNRKFVDTQKGKVVVENYYPAEEIARLRVDEGLFMFSRHNPERQKKALENVALSEGGNVIASVKEQTLVGYIGIHHPSERERWGKPSYPWLYELGAIEVSQSLRRNGLAKAMLDVAFDDPFYDDKIVITTGFTWHWDLEGTGLSKFEYRTLGVELFGRYGFMEMSTDEPNIMMDPANLFLVRIGKSSTFSQYQKFASLLFANEWEAMLRGF